MDYEVEDLFNFNDDLYDDEVIQGKFYSPAVRSNSYDESNFKMF